MKIFFNVIFSLLLIISVPTLITALVLIVLKKLDKVKFRHVNKILIVAPTMAIISFVYFGVVYTPTESNESETTADLEVTLMLVNMETTDADTSIIQPTETITELSENTAEIATDEVTSEAQATTETQTISVEERIIENVKNAIGDDKFNQEESIRVFCDGGYVMVNAQARDNLTASLTRKSIIHDIRDILRGISSNMDDVKGITFNVSCVLVDSYGNENVGLVLKARYSKKTIQAINWENELLINFEQIADDFWVHDAFK